MWPFSSRPKPPPCDWPTFRGMLVKIADHYLAYESKSKVARKQEQKALQAERRQFSVCDEMMHEIESMVMDTIWEPPNYRPGKGMVCLAAYRQVLIRGLPAAETFAALKAAFKEVTGEDYD